MSARTIPPKPYASPAETLLDDAAIREVADVAKRSHPMFTRGWISGVAWFAALEGLDLSVLDLVRRSEGVR